MTQSNLVYVTDIQRRPTAVPAHVAPPTEADIPGLVALVNAYARRGDLLPRSEEAIRATLDTWVVGKMGEEVVACGSLLHYSPVLAEVRSLAVADMAQGTGLGRRVVETLIEVARTKGIPTLFALTRAVPFFLRLGFSITEKEFFPQKVWTDCAICPLKDACDETAVVLELES
jgi:amino-acid N-acetyltransferase